MTISYKIYKQIWGRRSGIKFGEITMVWSAEVNEFLILIIWASDIICVYLGASFLAHLLLDDPKFLVII